MKRSRGTGSVYRRGEIWWYSFERDGELIRESSSSTLKTVAQAKLDAAIKELNEGIVPSDFTVSEAMALVFDDYETNGYRSLQDAKERWDGHLKPVFGKLRCKRVTTAAIRTYRDNRRAAGAAKATINRELALLRRAFSLARDERKLYFIPKFPLFSESDNVRTGFLDDTQYEKLAAACAKRGLWLRAMFETGYTFGWRSSELTSMRVSQFDSTRKTLRLLPGTTKNDEGRIAYMPSSLFQWIEQCAKGKSPDDFLFTRDGSKDAVLDFRGAWYEATKEAGFPPVNTSRPGLLFHDLRRTAVRNLVEKHGVSERVAMKVTGHKTRAVFDRYHIVADRDLADVARKMESSALNSQLTHSRVAEAISTAAKAM
ncbi:MAG: tyrosine-type recombinase/integrase [Acidobacteriota bacterium]